MVDMPGGRQNSDKAGNVRDVFNQTEKTHEAKQPDISTKAELEQHTEDRRNDPPVPEHNHPAPDWVMNPDSHHRQRMRKREQRVNQLRDRLGRASGKLERDFDRSR